MLLSLTCQSQTVIYKKGKIMAEGRLHRFHKGWITLEVYDEETNSIELNPYQLRRGITISTAEVKVFEYISKNHPGIPTILDTVAARKQKSYQEFPEYSAYDFRQWKSGLNVIHGNTSLSIEQAYDSCMRYLGINRIAIDAQNRPYIIKSTLIKTGHGSGWIELTFSTEQNSTLVECRAWGSNNEIINIIIAGQSDLGDIRFSTGSHPNSPNGYIMRVGASTIFKVCGDVNFYKERLTSW